MSKTQSMVYPTTEQDIIKAVQHSLNEWGIKQHYHRPFYNDAIQSALYIFRNPHLVSQLDDDEEEEEKGDNNIILSRPSLPSDKDVDGHPIMHNAYTFKFV